MKLIPDWALEKLGYRRFEVAPVNQGEEEAVAEVIEVGSALRTAYWPEAQEPLSRASTVFSIELPEDMHESLCEWFMAQDIWYVSHTPEVQNQVREMEGGISRMYVISAAPRQQRAWMQKVPAMRAELKRRGLTP